MLILNACNVLNWSATIRTRTLEFQPGEDTFSVDESLATSKSKYVHVWLIIETMTDIQRIEGRSVALRLHIPPLCGKLFPKYSDRSSLLYTNNEIIVATYEETLPLFRDQVPDSANTVCMIYLKLGN